MYNFVNDAKDSSDTEDSRIGVTGVQTEEKPSPQGGFPPSLGSKGRPIGRPKKKDILAKTPGKLAKRGRPPGEAAAMAEFKARLINSPKSRKVLEKIFDAALDDDHKSQAAAWKLIVERLAPLSSFEKGAGGKAAVTINITGIGSGVNISPDGDTDAMDSWDGEALEAEYEAVDPADAE